LMLLLLGRHVFAAPPETALVTEGGVPVVPGSSSVAFDWGERRAADAPISHTFYLRNRSNAPLFLYRLQASCGCTAATLGGSGASPALLPYILTPGAKVALRVRVAPAELEPGAANKSVWIYYRLNALPGGTGETIEVQMKGVRGGWAAGAVVPPTSALPFATHIIPVPVSPTHAPDFTLSDLHARPRSLRALRGKPVVLFFSCGCPSCTEFARLLARSGVPVPVLVVFSGTKAAATTFLRAAASPDTPSVRTLLDTDRAVTETLYAGGVCPRVVLVSGASKITFDESRFSRAGKEVAPALLLSHTRSAARASISSGD